MLLVRAAFIVRNQLYSRPRAFSTSKLAMAPYKRLILCADGTWQSANNGSRSIPSNVAKLSRCLKCWDDKGVPQVVYYDTGIGTNLTADKNASWFRQKQIEAQKAFEGGTGAGLAENVCEAYNFVVNNWSEGDEIYIFGFSRGAYTARCIAALLAEVGICENAMMDQFWEMYEAYKSKAPSETIRQTAWGQTTEVISTVNDSNGEYWLQKGKGKQWLDRCKTPNIVVVGVWDTVGALGLPDNVIGNIHAANMDQGFHNTDIHPAIKNAFHALAIDERRRPFTPTIWYKPAENTTTNLVQCWFPGVHINIGGGADDGLKELTKQVGDLEGMANITFAWMVDRIRECSDLKFDDDSLDLTVARFMDNMAAVLAREVAVNAAAVSADAAEKNGNYFAGVKKFFSTITTKATPHPAPQITFRGWGVGPISDSFATSSLATQTVGGSRVRAPGRYLFQESKSSKSNPTPPAVQKTTNEYIHPVVAHAWSDPHPAAARYYATDASKEFLAVALIGFERQSNGDGKGYSYVQKATQDKDWIDPKIAQKTDGSEWTSDNYPLWRGPVKLPEFQIPTEGKFKSMERRLMTTSPHDQVKLTWTGEARLASMQKSDKEGYDHLMRLMHEQNDRAKQSLAAWDKANGFA